jgi:hypothetical protein
MGEALTPSDIAMHTRQGRALTLTFASALLTTAPHLALAEPTHGETTYQATVKVSALLEDNTTDEHALVFTSDKPIAALNMSVVLVEKRAAPPAPAPSPAPSPEVRPQISIIDDDLNESTSHPDPTSPAPPHRPLVDAID